MVGGLKVLSVMSGREREFEQLLAELRNEMRRHEPGCLLYSLLKSRKEPSTYIVHEQYVDQAALDAHTTSQHGARYFPRIHALLEHIEVEHFDGVAAERRNPCRTHFTTCGGSIGLVDGEIR